MEHTPSHVLARGDHTPRRGSHLSISVVVLLSMLTLGGCQLPFAPPTVSCHPEAAFADPVSTAPSAERWQLKGDDLTSVPVAANGMVYVASGEIRSGPIQNGVAACQTLVAVDGRSGAVRWHISGDDPDGPYVGPTIADGIAYVGTNRTIIALDALTGAERWRFTSPDRTPVVASPVVAGGVVYVSFHSSIAALDMTTGRSLWLASSIGGLTFNPMGAPMVMNGALNLVSYVFDPASKREYSVVSSWDARTGAPRWHFSVEVTNSGLVGSSVFPFTAANGMIFAALWDGKLYGLDERTGTKRWQAEITPGVYSERPSAVSVTGGMVFAARYDGVVYGLDALTGTQRWRIQADGPIYSLLSAGGLVYARSFTPDAGSVYALDGRTGTQRWRVPLQGSVVSGPTLANGVVYTWSDTNLFALDASSGGARWQAQVIPPGGVGQVVVDSPVVDGGAVYLAAGIVVVALNA